MIAKRHESAKGRRLFRRRKDRTAALAAEHEQGIPHKGAARPILRDIDERVSYEVDRRIWMA